MPQEFRTHDLLLPQAIDGLRFDQALARALPQYSRARLKGWIETGKVLLEGTVPSARAKVFGGERVTIEAEIETVSMTVEAESLPLDIVHADAALIVVNKPAGLVVHPGAGNAAHTLQNALLGFDPSLAKVPRAGIVHRIDKDTSGLLVIARTIESQARLSKAIAAHGVERRYLGVCVGAITGGRSIDEPIGRHRTQRTRMTVRPDGREAVTNIRIVKRFAAHTLVRAELQTGRTHQIRVHLAHIGHPLVGDPAYGGRPRLPRGASDALISTLRAFRRQALHAESLGLEHPETGKFAEWSAPPPADFQELVAALELSADGE